VWHWQPSVESRLREIITVARRFHTENAEEIRGTAVDMFRCRLEEGTIENVADAIELLFEVNEEPEFENTPTIYVHKLFEGLQHAGMSLEKFKAFVQLFRRFPYVATLNAVDEVRLQFSKLVSTLCLRETNGKKLSGMIHDLREICEELRMSTAELGLWLDERVHSHAKPHLSDDDEEIKEVKNGILVHEESTVIARLFRQLRQHLAEAK
jgi:hypothetical protein